MTTRPVPRPTAVEEPSFERSVLANGMRVVTQAMPHARSVSMGLFVGVGSRHEDDRHAGLSHLLEHLVFKGTEGFPDAGALSEAVEGCGGSVNASTDREITAYTARVPAAAMATGLGVVRELALRPLLRHADLVAEKPIIVDEIRMYIDSPSDHVFTIFDELLFGDHPLGREIAGTPGSVRRATRASAREHWAHWYRPERMVLAAAGATDHASVLRIAEHWFATGADTASAVRNGTPLRLVPPPQIPAEGALRVVHRDLAQGNVCLGMPGVSRTDPDRYALDLLGAILGDGMSSRLFLELRERRSLAYDVSTFASMYADCGVVGIHAGFDPDRAEEVLRAILDELDRVTQDPVAPAELERARAYTRGRLELRMEETGPVASWLGTGELLLPRILSVAEVVERLDAVSTDDILRVAREYMAPQRARVALLGPFRGTSRFQRVLAA